MRHRKLPGFPEDPSRSGDFLAQADSFETSEFDSIRGERWNAAGLLLVHACIAWCDAVSIRLGGMKSRGDNHEAAWALLEHIVTMDPQGKRTAGAAFKAVVRRKNEAAYDGIPLDAKDIARMSSQYETVSQWCRKILKEK